MLNFLQTYGKPFVSKLSIQRLCCVRLQNRLDSAKNHSIVLRIDSIVIQIDSIVIKNRLDCAQNRLNWN